MLATLEFLAACGLKPTVTSLHCGHGSYTASGNVSHHSSGNAVDIATINGIPILGHQGEGSITDITIRRLLTLQGTMKPDQIISLMTFDGADNTIAMGDHADHIHVGFTPLYGTDSQGSASRLNAILKPKQWIKLIDRLGEIDNPTVRRTPSKYSIDVTSRPSAQRTRTTASSGRRPGARRRRAARHADAVSDRWFAFVQCEFPGRLGPTRGATSCDGSRATSPRGAGDRRARARRRTPRGLRGGARGRPSRGRSRRPSR